MIYLNQGQLNQPAVVCERNTLMTGTTYYLWSVTHKLTSQNWSFLPYKIPPSVSYQPGYDLFCITVDDTIPQSLTGNTTCGSCNVHLIPGEYYIKIYGQSSATNLDVDNAQELVYETIMWIVGTNQNNPITYSGTSDIFIVYNEDND